MEHVVSQHADLDGPVHYLDYGGEGPPLVCVHGLAGSALNWMSVAPALAATGHRVLAPDLRGFGRTPLGRGSSLAENRRLLDRFLRDVAGAPAIVVGNSMGGLLALRQAALQPETVDRLVLVDPALPWRGHRPFDPTLEAFVAGLLSPLVGRVVMARGARAVGAVRIVEAAFGLCCADPSVIPADVVAAHVALERDRQLSPRSQIALVQAARSLIWALGRSETAAYERVSTPALIIQGRNDRLVPAAFSEAIGRRYGWRVEVLPEVGHLPMLEAPDRFVDLVERWLASQRPAAA